MLEVLLLTGLAWLAYFGVLGCVFVSDDIEGIYGYDGKLRVMDYGHFSKWFLNKIFGKDPLMNHIFSILLHNANVILLYLFLLHYIPSIALYAAILFAVHPICAQSVDWISGRGYPISLFFTLLGYNLIISFSQLPIVLNSWLGGIVVVGWCVLYYFAIEAQFATLTTFIIQFFLGNYFIGFLGFVISLVAGLGIIKEVINIRVKAFKEQNLGASTTFKPSKIIFALKSFYYYTLLCFFPRRLGLYHSYLYHYDENTEKEDKYSWRGFGLVILAILGFWFGNFALKFGIVWWVAYSFIFMNWVTIHQTFSERYIYIASIGVCIISAVLLHIFPRIFAFIVGIAIMRLWVHHPTFNDEIYFYQSNIWNFPMSEVAFANLGVAYLHVGKPGSAMDMWAISIKINPQYDVPYYNLHSMYKKQGNLSEARIYLDKAVKCKVCHFKETWTKELDELDKEITFANQFNELYGTLLKENTPQSLELKKQLDNINNLTKTLEEETKQKTNFFAQEKSSLNLKLVILKQEEDRLSKGIALEEIITKRVEMFAKVKSEYERIKNETPTTNILQV